MGDTKAIGRIGLKAMLWFVGASFVSLLIGLIMVTILRPGDNLNLPLPDVNAATNLKASSLKLKDFITHLVPRSAVEAMATNEILQIVVFSIFFGVAAGALAIKAQARRRGIEELAHIILKVTGYIMNAAPVAVFAAMAGIVTTQGLGILVTYGKFIFDFYLSIAVLWRCWRSPDSCCSATVSCACSSSSASPSSWPSAPPAARPPIRNMEQLSSFR